MCSKHDDPSMHDMPRQLDAEEEYAMRFYGETLNCPNCDHLKKFHAMTHGCLVPMGSDGQQEYFCNCMNKYVGNFAALHNNWMLNNDPNTWAWLLPRDVRLEKYSEAVHGANQMRSLAYAKVVEPVDWWEASKNNYNGGFNSFEEAVEYYK